MKIKKSARKYAASGKLKQEIKARHQHKQMKKKIEGRRARKGKGQKSVTEKRNGKAKDDEMEEDIAEESDEKELYQVNGEDEEEHESSAGALEGKDSDDEDSDEEGSLESLDDISDEENEGVNHALELSKLKEKDPEFYKYLEENDRELLEFDPAQAMEGVDLSDEDMAGQDSDEKTVPALTPQLLKSWQKALLEFRSLRALRKLLLAFRSAAYANDEDASVAWAINDASLFDKVINTCLKYTPVVLDHHIPYRTLPNGKYKPPIQSSKQQKLSKLIASFFSTVLHLLTQLTEPKLVISCLTGSAKLVPYISGNRKAIKSYLRACLSLWSSPGITTNESDDDGEDDRQAEEDKVRLAAFLSIRRIAMSSDEGVLDLALKGSYTTLLRASKSTNPHSLPSITLMKNTAVDLYCIDQEASYQLAFGYIRQLAVTLRNALKGGKQHHKDKDAEGSKQKKAKNHDQYKQVYNWQFVHAVDFWSMLLSRACGNQEENELRPLIYPLVQVALGAAKLSPNSRYYPFHLHMLQPLQTLSRSTFTYIPLSPSLLTILSSLASTKASAGSSSKSKSSANSTLKPLLLATHIRAPTAYLKTRIYIDEIIDEALFLLLQWAAQLQSSVAFAEVIVPVIVGLKRSLKVAKQTKGQEKTVQSLKTAIERLEEGRNWTLEKRKGVGFAPNDRTAIDKWQEKMTRFVEKNETPIGKYTSVLERKRIREQAVLEKARQGRGEILEDDG